MNLIEFLPETHPINGVGSVLRARIVKAQRGILVRQFSDFGELCERVFGEIKLNVPVPQQFRELPADAFSDKMFTELSDTLLPVLQAGGLPPHLLETTTSAAVRRLQLLLAFENPDYVLERTAKKVLEIVSKFPKSAKDIEKGKNPGDVIDPYILAATQHLVFEGDFVQTIGAAVSHKILMMIEGLMGHMHEDVLGEMRGNVRAPEPRGDNQEALHPDDNPFPGADLLQPPTVVGGRIRFHQIKSKTGSAKGGDAKRLGDQLRLLEETYDGEIFYDALIGNTLKGHRSKGGVIAAAPNVTVLVGAAAFRELTRSTNGPQLLLRLYIESFQEAARISGYSLSGVLTGIVDSFQVRAGELKEGLLDAILCEVTEGPIAEQDSRHVPKAVLKLL